MAREERRRREREEERARAAAARGGVVSGRTRTARGEGDGRDYSEVRARAPNGSQEVAARVRGGHVTARTRSVGLGRRRVDKAAPRDVRVLPKKRRVGGRTSHLARGDRVPIHLLTYFRGTL